MKLLAWLAIALIPSAALGQVTEWKLDKNHSQIGFTARHLGFAKVNGHFTSFQVTDLKADASNGRITALTAEVDATSVDTGIKKRDDHLRSDDFFAAATHPKMVLKLKSITWDGDEFDAVVALTLRGTTREVAMKGEKLGFSTVNFGQGPQLRTAYEATGKVNRKEFGLNFSGLAEGVSIVGDEVTLKLEASFWTPASVVQTAAQKR